MPTSLVTSLPALAPVRDPLRAIFADASAPASGRTGTSEVEVNLEVEDVYNSGNYRLIGEFLNPYDYSSDQASAYLNRALLGTLWLEPPHRTSGDTAYKVDGLVKRYRVKSRDVVEGEPVGTFNTQGPYHAWMAGRSYVNQKSSITTGYGYRFLSTRSTKRRYFPDEFLPIFFMPFESGAASLKITQALKVGGPNVITKDLGTLTAFEPKQINFNATTTGILSFTIEITGLSGIAPSVTYTVEKKPKYLTQLLYGNSLGGFDVLAMTGKQSFSNEAAGEIIETPIDPANGDKGNYRVFNQKAVDTVTFRTGYLSFYDRLALKDMALVNEVYLLTGGQLRKLILTNTEQLVYTDGEFLRAVEFTARYAYDNHAYNNVNR